MQQSDDLSDLPDLEDFSDELNKIKGKANDSNNEPDIGDYTKTKAENTSTTDVTLLNKDSSTKSQAFSGLKKGFFNEPKPKKPENDQVDKQSSKKSEVIQEIKPNPNEKSKNPLEIPEVQAAMNMNNFLLNDKDKWLTPELLKKISENPILAKLFTNPEYLNAMTLLQKDPKGIMEKYGKNPEFMQVFQEFCKMMGTHFNEIAKEPPAKDPEAEKLQKIVDNDQEVKEILKDPQVQSLLQFLSTNKKVELNKIMQKNPVLTQKINILIKKGIINVQNY